MYKYKEGGIVPYGDIKPVLDYGMHLKDLGHIISMSAKIAKYPKINKGDIIMLTDGEVGLKIRCVVTKVRRAQAHDKIDMVEEIRLKMVKEEEWAEATVTYKNINKKTGGK